MSSAHVAASMFSLLGRRVRPLATASTIRHLAHDLGELNFAQREDATRTRRRVRVVHAHPGARFTADDTQYNPVVIGRMRRSATARQITDGAVAGLVLAGRRKFAEAYAHAARGQFSSTVDAAHPVGWGHAHRRRCTLDSEGRGALRQRGVRDAAHVRRTITDAYQPRRHRRTCSAHRRHRDPRLLHVVRVHGHRPLRHHRPRRERGRPSRKASSTSTASCPSTRRAASSAPGIRSARRACASSSTRRCR